VAIAGYEILSLLLNWRGPSVSWAGYTTNLTTTPSEVSGYFTVPSSKYNTYPTAPPFEEASEWVGYGGSEPWVNPPQTPNHPPSGVDLWQAGVTEWYGANSSQYYTFMWFEPVPDSNPADDGKPIVSVLRGQTPPYAANVNTWTSSFQPKPGDVIEVTIGLWYRTTGTYTGNVSFFDVTTNQTDVAEVDFSLGTTDYPITTSVEWIMESPSPNAAPSDNYPLPDVTSNPAFYGGWFILGNYPFYLNSTYPLLQWEGDDTNDYSSTGQWLCPGLMTGNPGAFSVDYSTTGC
jgi:Peptidase A4 family